MVALLLLEKGADLNAKTHYGQTVLHLAATNGHETVARLLLEKGVDVNEKTDGGKTALRMAAENGYQTVVRLLTPLTSTS
jgi:ankyrin repeat protein